MAIDAAKFHKEGVYEARVPLRALLEDLDQIGNMVQAAEQTRHRIRLYSGLAMIVGLLSAVLAGIVNSNLFGFCAFLAFATGVGLFISSFIIGRDLHSHHDRYDLLKELSKTLQHDADPQAKFTVHLALKASPKLLREEPFPERKNGKQQFFEEDFLSIEGELLDGTFLEESVTELTRKRSFTNPRGKSKTKTRNRYALSVRLGYPSDLYGDARQAHQALNEAIQVPTSATIKDVGVSEKTIIVKTIVQAKSELTQASAMVCLGAYRILNLARRGLGGPQGEAK